MDRFDELGAPGGLPRSVSPLLRPGRLAALLVLAGLVAGTLFAPNNPLRAFLRPILSPSEPLMVADLFFALALGIVLVDRVRGALAVAAGLGVGGLFAGLPTAGSLRATLLARRGASPGGSEAPEREWASGSAREDAPADERSDEPATLEDEEDPWR